MRVYFRKKAHDYPKRAGDCYLAWYNQGKICILKKKPVFVCQKQHLMIQAINQISLKLWPEQSQKFKKDMAEYAKRYKVTYPGLRKRGISAYSIFLKIIHGLIKRFSLHEIGESHLNHTLKAMLMGLSVYKCILSNLLKRVNRMYCLNHKTDGESEQPSCYKMLRNFKRVKLYHFEINDRLKYINTG